MNRLARALRVVRLRGIRYLWYVIKEVVVKTIAYRVWYESRLYERRRVVFWLSLISFALLVFALGVSVDWLVGGALLAVGLTVFSFGWMVVSRRRSRELDRVVSRIEDRSPAPVAMWSSWPVDQQTRLKIAELAAQNKGEGVTLGWIDNDGRVCSDHEDLPGLTVVEAGLAVPRYRFALNLLVAGDAILVEKDFRGDKGAFLRECLSLGALDPEANAPRLHAVDCSRTTIRKSFAPGRTVRDHLVSAGARILSIETDGDPDLREMEPGERIEAVWERGRQVFNEALPASFLSDLERQIDQLHRAGVTGFSLTFGNVVVHETTGEPWLIDFDSARFHRSTKSLAFRRDRDRDRDLFNRIYGTEIMTEQQAREILRNLPSGYAPVDLGGGLVTRGFWSVDSGTGRWEYLNGRALEGMIEGNRILDLGSNNGIMPLMMLRSGASTVVGVERSPELVDAAVQLHRIFEWVDMKSYGFVIRSGDMLDAVTSNSDSFDVVTAFCSLYYLDEDEMLQTAVAAKNVAPRFLIQANEETRSEAGDNKSEKSSISFLKVLLEQAGYSSVVTRNRGDYPRPLLIASD